MDSTRYTETVAAIVGRRIKESGSNVWETAKKAAVPRTTLQRRLDAPSQYPFNIAELARISDAIGTTVGEIVRQADEIVQKDKK
ncbi:hypothetical protein [Bifidobacterium animalis]|uniref:hypothetical protein n=1 Tax=Bifidobacterium animalis TaxID=28025 RepID=UPI00102164DB|nr:hypothetical protein [Bifidobacterium animalis]